jgi:MFS family permease
MIRDRSIVALLVAELVSQLGSQFTALALPWFVLVTTGSPTKMGLVFAAELIPMALLGIPAGSVVDRLGPRASMLLADGARAPLIALVPLLHELGALSFGLILVLGALHGVFSSAYFACQRTILPAIVGEDERTLAQANTLIEGATNITTLLGPALAGLAIALIGATNVMWIDAASFLVAFVLIGTFVRVARQVHEADGSSGGVLAGLQYLRRDTFIARVSLSSLTFGFLFPMLVASFPVLAYRQYDHNPRIAGLLISMIGGGQVVGSLLAYKLVTLVRPLRLAGFAAVLLAAPLWLLVPQLPLALVGLALALVGAGTPLVNAPYIALLQTRVPAALRGKVLQAIITINRLAGPAGYAVAGTLFVHIGLHAVYALIAGLATLASANFIVAILTGDTLVQETA